MVKQRMTTADVAAEVACLRQRILGMRLANFYDINPKVLILTLEQLDNIALMREGLTDHD